MKYNCKCFLCLVLTLVMVFGLFSGSVFATENMDAIPGTSSDGSEAASEEQSIPQDGADSDSAQADPAASNSSMNMSLGTIVELEDIQYLEEGLGLAPNEDGTYTVTDKVAQVNDVVYSSIAAAEEAADDGDTIKLLAMAPVKGSVVVDQDTVIDLNNHTIYAIADDVYPIIRALADVTVTGEGGVDAKTFGSGYAFIVGNSETAGTLTIKAGSYYGTVTVASVTKGTLQIENGYFEATAYTDENGVEYGYRYTINCIDSNYADGSAVVSVRGGTYYAFNPMECDAEGENTNFCAEAYVSVDNGDNTWNVLPDPAHGFVAYNKEDDLYYEDLSVALDAAEVGETVQLVNNCSADLVLVPAGVTFDLNGNVIEAATVLSFGIIMDGMEDVGGIKINIDTAEAFTKLQPENGGYLPVYDTRDGMYKFFAYDVESNKYTNADDNTIVFYTRIVFDNAAGYEVLGNSEDTGIDFVLSMDWTGMSGFKVRYTMSDGILADYANAAYAQLGQHNYNKKALTATIKGIDKLRAGAFISAAPSVMTTAEVTDSADALMYTVS